jgi:hypothetical protein
MPNSDPLIRYANEYVTLSFLRLKLVLGSWMVRKNRSYDSESGMKSGIWRYPAKSTALEHH